MFANSLLSEAQNYSTKTRLRNAARCLGDDVVPILPIVTRGLSSGATSTQPLNPKIRVARLLFQMLRTF
jgi:hypothetical protein